MSGRIGLLGVEEGQVSVSTNPNAYFGIGVIQGRSLHG
jgi:hypothetical protein